MTASRPVAEGLFTDGDEGPALIGARCRACGTTTFPRQDSCPRCARVDMEERPLPRSGTLWSFTVQGFRPKPPYTGPEPFEPYGVGYVDLDGEVIVEARLTENDPARLRIGAPVDLVLEPFTTDADGTRVVTFAFAPRG
ncbi:OB-fold domain-containing protein [Actinomadura vinacea]|uniref:OB-fold domain-containing protein n=1 Tax=Actinomadura vinacea TaxID=115336 RepID=A0ABN3KB31_9ACTN